METAPKSAEVRFNMALSMFKLAEIMESSERREPILRKALAVYDEVLALDPGFHRAHYNKAVIHHILGESESEIVEYKKAVQIKTDYAPALYNLAAALSATERYEDAIEAWEKYINAARMNADEKTFVENARKEVARLRGQ
jgi:tetratricopeptide (TPR) repeat protein